MRASRLTTARALPPKGIVNGSRKTGSPLLLRNVPCGHDHDARAGFFEIEAAKVVRAAGKEAFADRQQAVQRRELGLVKRSPPENTPPTPRMPRAASVVFCKTRESCKSNSRSSETFESRYSHPARASETL